MHLLPARGNLAPVPGVFPDYLAPVIRHAGDDEEMVMMRCACAAATDWWIACDEHPQHRFDALAHVHFQTCPNLFKCLSADLIRSVHVLRSRAFGGPRGNLLCGWRAPIGLRWR
jgi:hypothetical protein